MKTEELDYHLPESSIAQKSVEPRDASRLLAFDSTLQKTHDLIFRDILSFAQKGDVFVFNNTKVFRARIFGFAGEYRVEVLLIRAVKEGWSCLGKPGKRLQVGAHVNFTYGVVGTVVERQENGKFTFSFEKDGRNMTPEEVVAFTDQAGEIPLPPYVTDGPQELSQYQTVYAKNVGSVAAPTAGFHFTDRVRRELLEKGVQFVEVTLHVGIGTFQPIKVDDVENHEMHSEMVVVTESDAQTIYSAKKEGRRIVAVGTTTTRALEGAADMILKGLPWTGDVNMFIRPGYTFRVIDALVTNFHLPKSTLMLLVSALIEQKTGSNGLQKLKKLYEHAILNGYRFYSFGDAMFIF